MKRPIFSQPEDFSLLPLLALLPVKGDIKNLIPLEPSLFARLEKVRALQRDGRRGAHEEAMLQTTLEWLSDADEKQSAQEKGE